MDEWLFYEPEMASTVGDPGQANITGYLLHNSCIIPKFAGLRQRKAQRLPNTAQQSAFLQAKAARSNDAPLVLVPGAGLGRLCHDIASLGFDCEVSLTDAINRIMINVKWPVDPRRGYQTQLNHSILNMNEA